MKERHFWVLDLVARNQQSSGFFNNRIMRIVTDKKAEPWDIVVYPKFKGKYGNNIFIFNSEMRIVNISLEFSCNFVGGHITLPKETKNHSFRDFAYEKYKEHYFHDGEGYVPPNGQLGTIILKYQDWKRWILTNKPETLRDFHSFIEKKALEVMGHPYFAYKY